jgi:hypothetical protein
MTKRQAAAVRRPVELSLREATVLRINTDGEALVEDGVVSGWAASAVPGLALHTGDLVLVTTTTDHRLLICGISRAAQPSDDVRFRAPKGRIVLEAGTDLELRAESAVRIESPDVDVTADRASLHVREASIIADVIRTTADEVATTVGRWELGARRIVERAVDVVRAYEGVLHLTTGRAHTVVREAYDLVAKRTSIASEEDTTIDGKRVLLG